METPPSIKERMVVNMRIYVNGEYYGQTPIEEQAKRIVDGLRNKGNEVYVKKQDAFGQWWIDANF